MLKGTPISLLKFLWVFELFFNVLEIISCTDSDGNTWKEVPFLAQDTIFDSVQNVAANDPELSQYSDEAPYLLKLLNHNPLHQF